MMSKKKKIILIVVLSVLGAVVLAGLIYGTVCVITFHSLEDTGIPRIDITTNGGAKIVSKVDYVGCTVSVSGTEEEYCFDGATAGIRGRGNDTWTYYPKKPYRIRFDEKTSMFGEEPNRSWVLLAMYNDFSLVKDRLAFGMAEALGADFAPCYHYVDLYVNGKYMGIYLLTDQVDENEGRTNVEATISPTDIEVPFLVELDARAPEEGVEGVDWFSTPVLGTYAVKYPDTKERYTQAQFDYIENYILTVDALCRKEGVTLAELEEYIDLQSFIDYYLILETMGQPELNWKSVYMSRSVGGKLVMGPVWDFDWAAEGPSIGEHAGRYEGEYEGFYSWLNWFYALYHGSPEFREALAARWKEIKPLLLDAVSVAESEKSLIERAAKRNDVRWNWYRVNSDYSSHFDTTVSWVRNRIAWIDRELCGG